MYLAIDFDNVLVPTSRYLLDQYNDLNGTDFNTDAIEVLNLNDLFQMHDKLYNRFVDSTLRSASLEDLVPSVSAIDNIPELAHSFQLTILSERNKEHIPYIMHWTNLYFPGMFQYVFCTNGFPKHQVFHNIGLDLLVDDNPSEVHGAHKLEHAAVLYGRPWNADVQMSYRVEDWKGLIELLTTE